ncbi:MAG TPA: cyclic nucleotide-binding domain-containing protein, partial [Candidatus Hodarchaeales archaeon]|nr:cyclic nucleotide-binding domain-containing protein [Candidatus Hodarchaeales archaeon]
MQDQRLLSRMRLFRTLTAKELAEVAKVVRGRAYKKGRTIIDEGAPGGAIYVVKSGELKVSHILRGTRRALGTFRSGDHFGEVSFIDKKPRSASIHATEDSELLVIPRNSFEKLLHDFPQIQIKLMHALLEDLCEKLRNRNDVLDFELSDLLPISIFEIDKKGKITFSNHGGLEVFGYTQQDFERGLNIFQMIVESDRDTAKQNMKKILSGEKLGVKEYT